MVLRQIGVGIWRIIGMSVVMVVFVGMVMVFVAVRVRFAISRRR
jgi:hypothetical protein